MLIEIPVEMSFKMLNPQFLESTDNKDDDKNRQIMIR